MKAKKIDCVATIRPWLAAMLGVAVTSGSAWAQQVATPAATPNTPSTAAPAAESTEEEMVVLSPFTITAEEDVGYVATSAMAGSRIKTNLSDIASAVSVVTKDMMRDIGAHDAALLLNYTLGTEVGGIGGNMGGAPSVAPGTNQEDTVNREFMSTTRVRGLSGADNSRDFFLTSIPWDAFNTDRIEISRGPNAMLFGTGSPAGIINMSTATANVTRNSTDVGLEVTNFGGWRADFSNNTKIIDNVLALRTAYKISDQRFQQEEAFLRDKRLFLAATYKPFKHTTIRGNYELGEQAAAKPEYRPPFDNGIMSWFEVGMPKVHPLTQDTVLTGPVATGIRYDGVDAWGNYQGANVPSGQTGSRDPRLIDGMVGWGGNNPTVVFDQPNRPGAGPLYGVGGGVWAFTNIAPPVSSAAQPTYTGSQLVAMRRSYDYMRAQNFGLPFANFYGERQITDTKIFNYFDHMLDSNKKEDAEWSVNTFVIEQLTPDRKGGIEAAYHTETLNKGFVNPFNWATYGISVDINSHLLDGSVNPNFGRPMVASDSWSTETREERKSMRLTAFYELEAKFGPEWLQKVLGKHTITGNWSDSSLYKVTQGGRALAAGVEWAYQNPRIYYPMTYPTKKPLVINNASRGFQTAVYLGNKAATPQGMNIKPITVDVLLKDRDTLPIHYFKTQWELDPTKTNGSYRIVNDVGNWEAGSISILRGKTLDKSDIDLDWTGGASEAQIESKVAILHSSILWNTIHPTIGWRTDTYKSRTGTTVLDPGEFSISKGPLPARFDEREQNAFNWGAVARLPASWEAKLPIGLRPSIFYNSSDNFEPTASRINAFGEAIAPLRGETKDYGFMVAAFDNKLSLRLTKYDTSIAGKSLDMRNTWHNITREGLGQVNVNVANGNNDRNVVARDAYINWWARDPFAQQIKKTFEFNPTTGMPSGTTDGKLIQTTDSNSQGYELEVTYNPTKSWRIALNYSEAEVINTNTAQDFVKFMEQWNAVMATPVGGVFNNYPGVNNDSGMTLSEYTNRSDTDLIRATAGDGYSANPELRKSRLNLLTNYTFSSDGFLKNVGVGGALRWEDEVLIGTGYKVDSLLGEVPDYEKTYMGPSRTTVDIWASYRRPEIFKNVDMMVKLNVRNVGQGDELIPVATQPDGKVRSWRIAEPMTMTLSTEFSF